MKFLVFFAVAAFIGSVHCDKECFRAVFKECARDRVPLERMTLCDEILFQVKCMTDKARECKMPFQEEAINFAAGVETACILKQFLEPQKVCYAKSLNASKCVEPINEAMKDVKTQEDFIKANKKVCNLIDTYEDCGQSQVDKNCHDEMANSIFSYIYKPLSKLNSALCEDLILPADEKDSRPDNFGVLNVFAIYPQLFV